MLICKTMTNNIEFNYLGNRTVTQVTSRVQKYFLKLYRAGLPVPGRIPKTVDKKVKNVFFRCKITRT